MRAIREGPCHRETDFVSVSRANPPLMTSWKRFWENMEPVSFCFSTRGSVRTELFLR